MITTSGLTFPRDFGRYTILGELGRGSMGVVYEARERKKGRRIALKVMRTGLGMDRQGFERFRREAEVAASLPHEHIVGTLDTGEADGEVFLTMPLLPGTVAVDADRRCQCGREAAGRRGERGVGSLCHRCSLDP